MRVGDLVRWTEMEKCYHIACRARGVPNMIDVRNCGIIVDKNPIYFFFRWENGDLLAQKPGTIEVFSEVR